MPLLVMVASQAELIVAPDGMSTSTVQLGRASDPAFTVNLPWKPDPQSESTAYVAVAGVAAVAVPSASGASNAAHAITDPRRIFRNGAPALGG
ncbi:hypothetical protein Misp03_41990 [Microbispora sp. NBRC 16548]|nr:hypothetical protein Misp03_41990 [Microbispora sp. NBRC 16548]